MDNRKAPLIALEILSKQMVQLYALRHDLVEILIAIAGIALGAENFEDVFDWATTPEGWLRRFLVLKHGIPSADTLNRVFRLLDPAQFEAAYQAGSAASSVPSKAWWRLTARPCAGRPMACAGTSIWSAPMLPATACRWGR